MIDHETLGRRLFLAVLDAGDKRSKIEAACRPILDDLSPEDRGRVEGIAFVLAMNTLSEACKLHPAAAANIRRASSVVVQKRSSKRGGNRG